MKKIFTLTSLLVISATSLMAQADTASNSANWVATPNPGLEDWVSVSSFLGNYYNPDGWNTANSQTADVGTYCVTRGTVVEKGTYSAELTTQSIVGQIAPGIITTGTIPTSTTGSITGGIPYTQTPDSIVGWFEYTPKSSDNCFFSMYLFGSAANNADTVATASFSTVPGKTTSTYTRFAVAFKYRNSDPVANSIWLISSSNGTSSAVAGSVLYVDELAVIINKTTGIANQVNPGTSITVSPNPASDHVSITNIANANTTLSLFDITGRKVAEQKMVSGANLLDVKTFTSGLYIYTLTDESNAPVKTGKLIIQK